jgi:DNA-binding LytR/AlgR family response regulator
LAAPVGIAGDGIGKDAGMYVRRDGEYTRLDLGQIDAVEAMENYVQILMGEERIVVHTTMKAIQEKLKPHGFIRIHRSYLVQAEKIKGFDETRVRVGERSFPLGKSFKSELMKVVQFL